jgi:DNA-binding response OmpR family regulator
MSISAPIHVAIVDDDASLCRSLGRFLRASGAQPSAYASAEAFLANDRRPQFDCLVLDVQLGGMSGIELPRQLMAKVDARPPFIFITAHDDKERRASGKAAGCAAYFRKSESGAEALKAIRGRAV